MSVHVKLDLFATVFMIVLEKNGRLCMQKKVYSYASVFTG